MQWTLAATVGVVAAMLVIPAGSFAQAPTGDTANGAGLWNADDPDDLAAGLAPGSIGFHATQLGGAGDNELDYRRQSDGAGFHAQIVCLEVDAIEQAFMRLVVDQSTMPEVPTGELLVAYADDNNDGRGDVFDLDVAPLAVGTRPCGLEDLGIDSDTIRGNIFAADEGAFSTPF